VGKISAKRQADEHLPPFRRGYRGLAGIEGRIHSMRRDDGLRRCAYHGMAELKRWLGWVWWLLGTSVRKSDGIALDFFMFPGAVALITERMIRAFLKSTCFMQKHKLFICSFGRAWQEGIWFQVRQEHLGIRNTLSVFLLLYCSTQAALRYAWCNPPKIGTVMIRSPCWSDAPEVSSPCGTCWRMPWCGLSWLKYST